MHGCLLGFGRVHSGATVLACHFAARQSAWGWYSPPYVVQQGVMAVNYQGQLQGCSQGLPDV